MEKHSEFQQEVKRTLLTILCILLETVCCAVYLLRIPSDAKNAFLFGLSKERLLLLSGFAAAFLFFALCAVFLRKTSSVHQHLIDNQKGIRIVFYGFLLFLLLFLLPDYRFGKKFAAYAARLKPYFLWGCLVFLTLTISLKKQIRLRSTAIFELSHQKSFPIFLAVFAALAVFIEITGIGKTTENNLWNKNGIPLQSIQLFFSVLIYGIFRKFASKLSLNRRWVWFFIIWIVSALIWAKAPLQRHFFAPGPYDPNYEYYPYSDAMAYDLPVYTALQGWGFNFHRILLKPVVTYTAFISRILAGGDFNRSLLIQSGLYGILPAIIFLFGESIGGFGCGILAAVFSILKEWNALSSFTVLTVNSRLVMSEFAMQIICAAYCYFVFRLLSTQKNHGLWAAAAGGIFALGVFTRYNFLAFLPAAFLLIFIAFRKNLKKILRIALIFCASAFLTMAPWLMRSKSISGMFFPEIYDTFFRTLLNQRYRIDSREGKAVIDENDIIYQGDSEIVSVKTETEDSGEITENQINTSHSVIWSILNHSLHNFTSSFLTLPMNTTFEDLEHLYKNETEGLWSDDWEGSYTLEQWFYIILWTLSFGVAAVYLWKRFGFAGMSIPYFWMVYAFSIGVSRSSGGRYIVPVNWIPMLLLALTISLLFRRSAELDFSDSLIERQAGPFKTAGVIFAFMLYFSSMILIEKMIPEKPLLSENDPLSSFEKMEELAEVDWESVKKQADSGQMNIHEGITVYPRFYYYRTGEHAPNGSFQLKDYSRLVFYGLNLTEDGPEQIEYLLPHTELINHLPNGSKFRSISCTSENGYEDILALSTTLPDGEVLTYVRDPLPAFACPVPEPVCDGIENCH